MRKIYLISLLLLPFLVQAQYAKYELVEWFTNTYCPICSSRNPALRVVYNENSANKLHRITIHPSVPYPQCPLYNFNKEDNGARQSFYGVGSTPTLYINGVRTSNAATVFEDDIKAQQGQQSPVALVVTEEIATSRYANVTIKVAGEVPDGEYKLFVAVVEQSVDLLAENGETDHLDVLRTFISSNAGDDFDMPGVGEETTVNYQYDLPNGVRSDQAYVVAFIQDLNSKIILNSGTRFDDVATSLSDVALEADLKAFPNPVGDRLNVSVGSKYQIHKMEIYNHIGQRVRLVPLSTPESEISIPVNDLSAGTYMLVADLGDRKGVIQLIKD
ncbi:MAG: Omp28-related outer membrane protein [Saprospiraceae bacterium]|nr:Omp28-related outer membrane protein [Saprospiraceae bacterium]